MSKEQNNVAYTDNNEPIYNPVLAASTFLLKDYQIQFRISYCILEGNKSQTLKHQFEVWYQIWVSKLGPDSIFSLIDNYGPLLEKNS